ncbi:MAG: GDSL-type esterase/lipase family protein [Tannerella sp.]|nr:GDSL-type esterase/lipase family protein [Tannerella sp.]
MKWRKRRIKNLNDSGIPTFKRIRIILLIIGFAGTIYGISPLPEKEGTDVTVAKKEHAPRAALTDSVGSQLSFGIDSFCRITDPAHSLDVFLEGLDGLLSGKDTVVKIVHLGDSHVQAGFYSGQVMHLLQAAFGNAGRGWIAPLKLAKINEPKDYRITSSTVKDWTVGRCVQKEPGCAWGLGGIGIQPNSETVDFSISITPVRGAGYAFNEVLLFRDEKAKPLLPVEDNAGWVQTAQGMAPDVPDVAVDTFRMAFTVDSLHLYSAVRKDAEPAERNSAGCYYGFSLTNGEPGILYHAIGQNGAMFVNYTNREYLRQLSLLKPSLLIVTLGTNEAFSSGNFRVPEFVSQVDDFVRLVGEYLPSTAILLTTPAESFRRTRNGYERNVNISKIANAITAYAEEKGIACFDLYHATGGLNSCRKWQKEKLLGRDRVHFSVEGYYEQGKLLYKALVRLKMNQSNTTAGEPV